MSVRCCARRSCLHSHVAPGTSISTANRGATLIQGKFIGNARSDPVQSSCRRWPAAAAGPPSPSAIGVSRYADSAGRLGPARQCGWQPRPYTMGMWRRAVWWRARKRRPRAALRAGPPDITLVSTLKLYCVHTVNCARLISNQMLARPGCGSSKGSRGLHCCCSYHLLEVRCQIRHEAL